MAGESKSIIDVSSDRLEEVTALLADAFHPDPLMRYIFEGATAAYGDCLRELMRFACLVRVHLKWPLLGVEEDARLVGVMGLTMPDEAAWPNSLQAVYNELGVFVGPKALRRLEEYSRLADSARPEERHYHVGVIGVAPNAQGRGIGRALMKAVHTRAQDDGSVVGVALDTENPDSRRFYEANGYHCTSEEVIGDVRIWNMFRANT
jgi:GNAT superfamily N-acetyltransferase